MILFNYLPQIFVAIVVAINLGLVIRLMLESNNVKIALISLFRLYFMPLALVIIINTVHNDRRKIIFDIKKSDKFEDQQISSFEKILEKKSSISWFVLKILVRYYRLAIDAYVQTAVKYELQAKKKYRKKNRKQDNFYDFVMSDMEVEKHLFGL